MNSTLHLLIEAIRRLDLFHPDKDPLVAWSGLGYKSEYKSVTADGSMEWVNGSPPPNCSMGWLRLTTKGLEKVNAIRANHGEPMVFDGYILRSPTSKFYRCGICDLYHNVLWNGDCRQKGIGFDGDELDRRYGISGWGEISMEDVA